LIESLDHRRTHDVPEKGAQAALDVNVGLRVVQNQADELVVMCGECGLVMSRLEDLN